MIGDRYADRLSNSGSCRRRRAGNYALRVARCLSTNALPAPIAQLTALKALAALGLSGVPFHDPFHGSAIGRK